MSFQCSHTRRPAGLFNLQIDDNRSDRRPFLLILATILAALIAAPCEAEGLDPSIELIADDVVGAVAKLLQQDASILADHSRGKDLKLSFTTLEGGLIPSEPNCAQLLHAKFNDQMSKLAGATGIAFDYDVAMDQAEIAVAIGDTRQLMEPTNADDLFNIRWKRTAARFGPAVVSESLNIGMHDAFSANWLRGLYGRLGGKLYYGQIWIHWLGVSAYRVDGIDQCHANFIEHILWLFAIRLKFQLAEQLNVIRGTSIKLANIDPYRDYLASRQIDHLALATLMCAQLVSLNEPLSLKQCSRRVAELVTATQR